MSASLSSLVGGSLIAQFRRIQQKAEALVAPLSQSDLWRRPYAYGNSVGHLLLHLTGNLNYYIGAQIAGTRYVRDRPKEFADVAQRAKDDVLADFRSAIATVVAALEAQGETDWAKPYSGVGADDLHDRLAMFLRCAAHADHHVGQIIYLTKQLALG